MKETDFEDILNAFREELLTKSGYFSPLTNHPGEKGRANESHLSIFLRDFLPKRYKVGTGFIEAVDRSYKRHKSTQTDIVLYDDSISSPLYIAEHWGVFPIELVHAIIEVKTTLRKGTFKKNQGKIKKATELYKSFLDSKSLRKMAEFKTYLRRNDHTDDKGNTTIGYECQFHTLPPRYFLFAYQVDGSDFKNINHLEAFIRNKVCKIDECNTHFHGVYILEKNWFLMREAYNGDAIIKFDGPESWIIFLNQLELVLEDVVPQNLRVDKTRYIRGLNKAVPLWNCSVSPAERIKDE